MTSRPDVDYNGALSSSYDAGRDISIEAEATWRAAIEPHLAGATIVADVGAGTGRFARRIADSFNVAVAAVEPAEGMRAAADRSDGTGRVTWMAGTAEALPLRSGSVDVLWSAFATHYYDLPAAAGELARVVAADGRVLIWHAFSEVFDDLEWFRWFPEARQIDESRMPSRQDVTKAFQAAGFELVEHSVHEMLITPDLLTLADRLSHRAISTLRLISDDAFEAGLDNLRAHAATVTPQPVHASNVLLVFEPTIGRDRAEQRYEDRLVELVGASDRVTELLRAVRSLDLDQWCIAAGTIRNLVWDRLHGHDTETLPSDIDVLIFDDRRTSPAYERALERRLADLVPGVRWEVVNQATIHGYTGDPEPYTSITEAMSRWADLVTAVGAWLDDDGSIRLISPGGLHDLFELQVRPNIATPTAAAVYRRRMTTKGWQERWPKLTIHRLDP